MFIKVEINILLSLSRLEMEEFSGRCKGCPEDNLYLDWIIKRIGEGRDICLEV